MNRLPRTWPQPKAAGWPSLSLSLSHTHTHTELPLGCKILISNKPVFIIMVLVTVWHFAIHLKSRILKKKTCEILLAFLSLTLNLLISMYRSQDCSRPSLTQIAQCLVSWQQTDTQ